MFEVNRGAIVVNYCGKDCYITIIDEQRWKFISNTEFVNYEDWKNKVLLCTMPLSQLRDTDLSAEDELFYKSIKGKILKKKYGQSGVIEKEDLGYFHLLGFIPIYAC